jgi:hypothetical protein
LTTRRPFPALYAALGVFVFMVGREAIGAVLYSFGLFSLEGIIPSLGRSLAYAAGVFMAFALFRITARSSTATTIGAGAVAALIGGFLVSVMALLWIVGSGDASVFDLMSFIQSPIGSILLELPLTVLAAVLVREWLRSRAAVDAPKEPASAV